jgi:hypothetical protein
MQPDPTRPALTAALQASVTLRAITSRMGRFNEAWYELLAKEVSASLAAQQPDERVAGLVEALEYVQIGLRWAVFKNVPSVYSSNEMRDLQRVVDTALAQPTAAGGAAGERCAFVYPQDGTVCGVERAFSIHPGEGQEPVGYWMHHFTPPAAPDAGERLDHALTNDCIGGGCEECDATPSDAPDAMP